MLHRTDLSLAEASGQGGTLVDSKSDASATVGLVKIESIPKLQTNIAKHGSMEGLLLA